MTRQLEDKATWKRKYQSTRLEIAYFRKLPNIAIIHVLVEELRADTNEILVEVEDEEERGLRKYWDEDELEDLGYHTLLHLAAEAQHWWQARQLLPYLICRPRVDLNVRDSKGRMPLHCALEGRSYYQNDIIHCLIVHGADTDTTDNNSQHSMDCAFAEDKVVVNDATDARRQRESCIDS